MSGAIELAAERFRRIGKTEPPPGTSARFVQLWITRPLSLTAGAIGLYIVTCAAALFTPEKILYTQPPGTPNVYLSGRAFLLASIGIYKLAGFKFFIIANLGAINEPLLGNSVDLVVEAALVVMFAMIAGVSVHIGCFAAGVRGQLAHHVSIGAYATGLIASLIFCKELMIVALRSAGWTSASLLAFDQEFVSYFSYAASLLLGVFLIIVYVIHPSRVIVSSTRWQKVVLGQIVGWITAIIMLSLVGVILSALLGNFQIGFMSNTNFERDFIANFVNTAIEMQH